MELEEAKFERSKAEAAAGLARAEYDQAYYRDLASKLGTTNDEFSMTERELKEAEAKLQQLKVELEADRNGSAPLDSETSDRKVKEAMETQKKISELKGLLRQEQKG